MGSRPDVSRFVRVLRLPSPRAALEALAEAALSGACALYVRNTVDDAVAAHRALSAVLPGRVDLFHTRFVLGDRQAIEKRILDRFGPGSTPEARRGRVVVATQVAEQSLDVDFDLAVSDLAPMESLVQRAGRCCRHRGRERPEGYGEPRLLVVSPDPEGEVGADWYAAMFRGAAHVYPAHGRLWRTARRLFGPGGFDLSREGRDLMERVYGEAAENLPQDGRIQAALLTPDPGPDPNVWRFEGTDGAGRAVRVRYSKSRGLEWGAGMICRIYQNRDFR